MRVRSLTLGGTMMEERAESLAADISAHIDCTNPMPVYLKASKNNCILRRSK